MQKVSQSQETPIVDEPTVIEKTATNNWPKIALPATADLENEYWKGIDLEPKPPVEPLSIEDQRAKFLLQPGYTMDAVLAEPQIQQPAQVIFDGNGRMYVLELRTYMLNLDSDNTLTKQSVISRWDDVDGDGVYETGGAFVDSLVFPRFVLPYGPNCVLTMESNEDIVYKYIDTNNDGKADKKEFFTDRFGRSGNVEHQQAFLYWGMDNWLYSTVNPFRVRESKSGVKRESTGSNKAQWGITHDDDGKLWFQGGSNGVPTIFHFPIHYGDYEIDSNFIEGFDVPYGAPIGVADMQGGMRTVRQPDGSLNKVTGASGNDIFRGDRLPKSIYGQYFYGEPVARIVRQIHAIDYEGLTVLENVYQKDSSEFLRSSDPLFRPVDMVTAPDGTMYICDMYHGIIQEGQWTKEGSYLRTKIQQYQLDKVIGLGRIWRLGYKDIPRDATKPHMYEQSTKELLQYLSHPNGWWRDMAQQVIVQRADQSVAPQLKEIVLHDKNINARFHALWCLEGIGSLEAELVRELLKDPNPRMRVMAMYAGESAYKTEDSSLGDDFLAMIEDDNRDVVIRAMMTTRLFAIADREEAVKKAMLKWKDHGVQLVGDQVLTPRKVTAFFGRADRSFTESEHKLLEKGEQIYNELCFSCHGNTGLGTPAGPGSLMAPSLVGSSRVKMHPEYVTKVILRGMDGPILGEEYAGRVMVANAENSDEWVASIASFIRASFDNDATLISPQDVAKIREETKKMDKPYTFEEIYQSIPKAVGYNDQWKVTASHAAPVRPGSTASPAGAFNFEGWTTGVGQQKGMWFQIELPEAKKVCQVDFNSQSHQVGFGRAAKYYPTSPNSYEVKTSMDGQSWKTNKVGETGSKINSIRFDPEYAKYLRIEVTAPDTIMVAPWSMDKMQVYTY